MNFVLFLGALAFLGGNVVDGKCRRCPQPYDCGEVSDNPSQEKEMVKFWNVISKKYLSSYEVSFFDLEGIIAERRGTSPSVDFQLSTPYECISECQYIHSKNASMCLVQADNNNPYNPDSVQDVFEKILDKLENGDEDVDEDPFISARDTETQQFHLLPCVGYARDATDRRCRAPFYNETTEEVRCRHSNGDRLGAFPICKIREVMCVIVPDFPECTSCPSSQFWGDFVNMSSKTMEVKTPIVFNLNENTTLGDVGYPYLKTQKGKYPFTTCANQCDEHGECSVIDLVGDLVREMPCVKKDHNNLGDRCNMYDFTKLPVVRCRSDNQMPWAPTHYPVCAHQEHTSRGGEVGVKHFESICVPGHKK